jgi:hypothetical protein
MILPDDNLYHYRGCEKRVNSIVKKLQPSVKCSTWQVLYKLTWPTDSNVVIQAHIDTFNMTLIADNLPCLRTAPQCIQESIWMSRFGINETTNTIKGIKFILSRRIQPLLLWLKTRRVAAWWPLGDRSGCQMWPKKLEKFVDSEDRNACSVSSRCMLRMSEFKYFWSIQHNSASGMFVLWPAASTNPLREHPVQDSMKRATRRIWPQTR